MIDALPKRTRRWVALGVVAAVVTLGATYALTHPTRWPAAFCRPVLRVSGADVVPLTELASPSPSAVDCVNVTTATGTRERCHTVPAPSPRGPTISSPVASTYLAQLHQDALLALHYAPTTQWRNELSRYAARTVGSPRAFMRGVALSDFDAFASTHLGACGVHPLRRP